MLFIHNTGRLRNDPEAISYGGKNPFLAIPDASVCYVLQDYNKNIAF
jgi:hypothetical protein